MESYKHIYAKQVLEDWLKGDFVKIELEYKFYLDGRILFIPDITCFGENGIDTIYEVVHKNEISAKTLARMQFYFFISDMNIKIYEVSTEWILRQIEKPENIMKYDLSLPEITF